MDPMYVFSWRSSYLPYSKKYLRCTGGLVAMMILSLIMFHQKLRLSDQPFMPPSYKSYHDVQNKIESSYNRGRSSDSYRQMEELYNGTQSRKQMLQELQRLGDLVQRRLFYLQRIKKCLLAVICKIPEDIADEILRVHKNPGLWWIAKLVGFGSQMRDWVTCLIVAYATQRTLIIESRGWSYAERGLETIFLPLSTNCTSTKNQTAIRVRDLSHAENIPVVRILRFLSLNNRPKYLPFAIPEDIADEILRVHKNPGLWWIGQFVVYLTRQNQILEQFVKQSMNVMGFRRPIVGIHVRRTDKRTVARYHLLKEYMRHVDAWFNNYEKRHHVDQRRVYLASDDTDVLLEARKRYPKYRFLSNVNGSAMAENETTRYSVSSLQGILLDIQMLSMCDFFVCTLSSNMGRLVYELMNVRYWDAPDRIRSLDVEYAFSGVLTDKKKRNGHTVKDISKNPLKPMLSLDNRKLRVKMPTYPEVPRQV